MNNSNKRKREDQPGDMSPRKKKIKEHPDVSPQDCDINDCIICSSATPKFVVRPQTPPPPAPASSRSMTEETLRKLNQRFTIQPRGGKCTFDNTAQNACPAVEAEPLLMIVIKEFKRIYPDAKTVYSYDIDSLVSGALAELFSPQNPQIHKPTVQLTVGCPCGANNRKCPRWWIMKLTIDALGFLHKNNCREVHEVVGSEKKNPENLK